MIDLICIGNELLTGLVDDLNGGYLARRLWAHGIPVRKKVVVGDRQEEIAAALEEALEKSPVVICCGGLGPTEDDLTREAVAALLNLPLIKDQRWAEKLERFFGDRGMSMPSCNLKQAMVIQGARLLDNQYGTAPGMIIPRNSSYVCLLPGPPLEMQPMFERELLPFLVGLEWGEKVQTRLLKCVGIGESLLDEKLKSLREWDNPSVCLVSSGVEVHIQLCATGDSRRDPQQLLEEGAVEIKKALQDYFFGEGEETLEEKVAGALLQRGETLATAESCTGGLMADSITDRPGSSRYFKGSIVAYDPAVKTALLGVPAMLIEAEGVVSEAVALEMARGARKSLKSNWGIGITGIAGPDGGTKEHPVGLVYVAAVNGRREECLQLLWSGSRRMVKTRTVQAAWVLLWRMMREDANS